MWRQVDLLLLLRLLRLFFLPSQLLLIECFEMSIPMLHSHMVGRKSTFVSCWPLSCLSPVACGTRPCIIDSIWARPYRCMHSHTHARTHLRRHALAEMPFSQEPLHKSSLCRQHRRNNKTPFGFFSPDSVSSSKEAGRLFSDLYFLRCECFFCGFFSPPTLLFSVSDESLAQLGTACQDSVCV